MPRIVVIGIDLAGIETNPSGWALWQDKTVFTCHLYQNKEIRMRTIECCPNLVAVDAPLNLPKSGGMRVTDKEMHRRGYPVFPPLFPAMKKLTLRAIELVKEIRKCGVNIIEVHPISTRKALNMPLKEWGKIQTVFTQIGLKGDLRVRMLSPHEIDAVTAALTGYLYLSKKIEKIGDEEGFIVVPERVEWRELKL